MDFVRNENKENTFFKKLEFHFLSIEIFLPNESEFHQTKIKLFPSWDFQLPQA